MRVQCGFISHRDMRQPPRDGPRMDTGQTHSGVEAGASRSPHVCGVCKVCGVQRQREHEVTPSFFTQSAAPP